MLNNKSSKALRYFLIVLALLVLPSLAIETQASTTELRKFVTSIKKKKAKWTARETSISKLPVKERMKRVGLNKKALRTASILKPPKAYAGPTSFAASLDYRDNNYVSTVKNQGACGSCWAFAAAATLESQIMIRDGALKDLSEQVLLSCSGAGSCSGGSIEPTSEFLKTTGIPLEECFTYTAADTSCSSACSTWNQDTFKISDYQFITTNSATLNELKNALTNYGPVITTMDVYEDFYYYSGGVYSHVSGAYQGGHAIELIGYDDTEQAFILKNSWGEDWGDAGFFKVAYSQISGDIEFGWYTVGYDTGTSACTPIRGGSRRRGEITCPPTVPTNDNPVRRHTIR